jgi:hypothetical protein
MQNKEDIEKLIQAKKEEIIKAQKLGNSESVNRLSGEIAELYKKLDDSVFNAKYSELIGKHKAAGQKVKRLVIEEEDNTKKALFFRMPSRRELSAAESASIDQDGKLDPYLKAERMIVDLFLGGDLSQEQILNDTEIFLAVSDFILYQLIKQKKTVWANC